MRCFENCFNLRKVMANLNWIQDNFPHALLLPKVSHCFFCLLRRLLPPPLQSAIQDDEEDKVVLTEVEVIFQAENVLLPSVMLEAYRFLQV